MKPDPRFAQQPPEFWANVRSISQALGYTSGGEIRIPSLPEMIDALSSVGLKGAHLLDSHGHPTTMGAGMAAYFQYRAHGLNNEVRPRLMDAAQAREVFTRLKKQLKPRCPIPMNKQKGKKKAPAYFTGIVNMLIESHCGECSCDFSPRQLTTITRNQVPLRTFSRWMDGAFPSAVNPVAVWELKEYYYTTTFGSRVADGVYESLLDGMELAELREHEGIHVRHYLMVDGRYTWWDCGKSYLCRILDMLNMGYVDEVLFGSEVIERLPDLVKTWLSFGSSRPMNP